MLRQAQIIRAGKDPEAAIVAAEEEIAYGRKIAAEEERLRTEQNAADHDDDEGSQRVAED